MSKTLDEVSEVIGFSQAIKLCNQLGGVHFFIPKNKLQDHPITKAIGHESAEKLSKIYGGSYIYLPTYSNAIKATRNIEIYQSYKNGSSIAKIALENKLTRPAIDHILNKFKNQNGTHYKRNFLNGKVEQSKQAQA